MNNIVLVRGAFVDGSGWEGVYKILRRDGYSVSIVQNPTISLEDDVAVTKRTLAAQDRPTILVGHSYGGAVITEAGNHPKVGIGGGLRAARRHLAQSPSTQGEGNVLETRCPRHSSRRCRDVHHGSSRSFLRQSGQPSARRD
jgi:predicted alpha/beta hydrolase family esterase